jgi:hypothetical protein
MAEKKGRRSWAMINRAPILKLWAAVFNKVACEQSKKVLRLE